jgi:excinuclease ABC subunit B
MLNEATGNLDVTETIRELEGEMVTASNNLEFEKAALLRDQVRELKRMTGEPASAAKGSSSGVSYGRGSKRKART